MASPAAPQAPEEPTRDRTASADIVADVSSHFRFKIDRVLTGAGQSLFRRGSGFSHRFVSVHLVQGSLGL